MGDEEGRSLTNLPSKNTNHQPVLLCSYFLITHSLTLEYQRGCDSAMSLAGDHFQPQGAQQQTEFISSSASNHIPWSFSRENHKHLAMITQDQVRGQVWLHVGSAQRQALVRIYNTWGLVSKLRHGGRNTWLSFLEQIAVKMGSKLLMVSHLNVYFTLIFSSSSCSTFLDHSFARPFDGTEIKQMFFF